MEGLKQVNKLIGEGIKNTTNVSVRHTCPGHSSTDTPFTSYRRRFCDVLRKNGYETRSNGNYVIANNGKETVTFYFAAHNPRNHNYLVSAVLENEVNYYAFYDNSNNSVYLVGYGIVRKYCKSLKESYTFYNDTRHVKLFIPDDWARQQRINTYSL